MYAFKFADVHTSTYTHNYGGAPVLGHFIAFYRTELMGHENRLWLILGAHQTQTSPNKHKKMKANIPPSNTPALSWKHKTGKPPLWGGCTMAAHLGITCTCLFSRFALLRILHVWKQPMYLMSWSFVVFARSLNFWHAETKIAPQSTQRRRR